MPLSAKITRAAADPGRPGGVVEADPARHRDRRRLRHPAGHRPADQLVRLLRAGEASSPRDPHRFGNGAIEGVAGPEAANNAAALTHFIPMLTLGIPAGAAMALMLGALIIQGIAPGPLLMTEHPDLFWGVVASMWIGNLMLLVLNLPLVGIWIRLLTIPYRAALSGDPGVLLHRRLQRVQLGVRRLPRRRLRRARRSCSSSSTASPAPLMLGLVLGPMLEENLRRALLLSRGDFSIFLTRPISLSMLLLTVALAVIFSRSAIRDRQTRLATPH